MDEHAAQQLTPATNSFGDIYIAETTQEMFLQCDAQTTFTQKINVDEIGEDNFYIVCGTDSGLLFSYFLKKEIPQSSRIVFVELPEIVHWLENYTSLPELPENVAIIEPDELQKQLITLDINSYILQDRLFYIPSLSVQYGYYTPYKPFSENILDYIKALHWNIRIGLDRKDFIIGQLENVAENITPHSIFFGKLKNTPAVLLAGGPSLDEIIEWVKKHRKKIVVFAVSRIANKLYAADVKPDFFVTVHTQDISFEVSKEMLLFHRDSILINHAQACPRLVGQWRGPRLYMGHILPWESDLNGPSKDLVGPTVSHAAYDVITKFGCNPIILGGVDLCFSQHNKSHASGSVEGDITVQAEGGDVKVITNDGKIAETTFAFHRGVLEFGKLANIAKNIGIKTYSPFSTSAKIDNVIHQPLVRIKLKKPQKKKIPHITSPYNNPAQLRSRWQKVITQLDASFSIIQKLREIALRGFKLATSKEIPSKEEMLANLEQCIEIEGSLFNRDYQWIIETVTSFEIHFFNCLTRPLVNADHAPGEHLEFYKLFFTAYIVSVDRLNNYIQKATARTHARNEEISDNPDIDILIDQWQTDKQPGRAYFFADIWKKKNHEIPVHHTAEITRVMSEFDATIASDKKSPPVDSKIYEWNTYRLDKLRDRILEAFSSSNSNTLRNLIDSLSDNDQDETRAHLRLAQGLSYELRQEVQSALTLYNKVIDDGTKSDPRVLQDCLSRIASISISNNDLQNAQLALQCLADLSSAHQPSYAEFLYLTGQKQQALDVYADYIGKAPDDIKTMLKIGQIYKEMNSKEGVKMITDHVLAKDPSNQTALNLRKFL